MKLRVFPVAACALLLGVGAFALEPHDADNTGKNVRDKDGKSLTVFDQGGSEADRNLTAAIRNAVVDDDSLSTDAHNVKIITVNGVTTLRGPVNSAAEKAAIESKAKAIAGVTRVDNQLEIDKH